MDIYHWALQPQRTGILKLVWAPHAEWANEDLIQRLLESILAFDLSLFYPCWWLMSVVKTPGRRLLWFAVVAVETLMSRVVLIFEITFKIHYLPSLERSWKSSTWKSNQTPPVAPFSLPWLDLSFLKLATLQPTALVTPSTIPEELCAGFGDTQPPASLRFQAGQAHISHLSSSFSQEYFKEHPKLTRSHYPHRSTQETIKGKDLPQETFTGESHANSQLLA